MLKKFFGKTLTVPSGDTKQVEAVRSWTVKWTSRHGYYSGDTRDQYEVFTDKVAADTFANALRNAFKLIRSTAEIYVEVTENKETD